MNHKQVRKALTFLSGRAVGLILAGLLIGSLAIPLVGAAPAAQTAGVIRLGYLGMAGSDTANGAQLAINEINAIGGITAPDGTAHQLELVTLSSDLTLDTFASALNELTAQDISVLLGPDSNDLLTPDTIQMLVDTRLPTLTPATADSLTDVDTTNSIFRTRAPEHVYSYAIATYLTEDLGFRSIAVVQTQVEYTEALTGFETALNNAGVTVSDRIQLPGGDALLEQVDRLINLSPQAIVMWGTYQDATALAQALRDRGWSGEFVYRFADEAARAGVLPDKLAEETMGVNSWTYAEQTDATRIFLREYVVNFGEVPGPLAVAAYDGVWFLRGVVRNKGVDPAAIRLGLLESGPQTLVQGVLHPLDFGNGDLSRNAVVYQLGRHGGPVALARYDDTSRLGAGGGATTTPEPQATPVPQETALPTATLEGAWVRVTANVLNVRTGPGFDYDKVGQVEAGDQFRILGAIADYSWLLIDYNGGVGWVKTEFVEILGDIATVSIIQPPPSPTPGFTATPSLPPEPDLTIDTVVLNPPQPIPGQPFVATVTVRNAGGGAAGRFAVAATWEPGSVYTSVFVEGLAGGQTTQVQLSATVNGTGVFQVAVVADLNKDVPDINRNNNNYNITYRVDYPILKSDNGKQINNGDTLNLDPGIDLLWDGANIKMAPGAQIGLLSGVTYENVHYDMLSPALVSYNSTGFGADKVKAGALFAVITSEGHRAVMRIDNVQPGGSLWVTYRTYDAPP
jgi:ABC-type branched-subunit amino acid transport system substrate-binding protein